jgi:hypothetical protein
LAYEDVLQEGIKMGRIVFAAIIIGGLVLSSICLGYSGGSGTAEEPYQIASKADLLALAGTVADYNKCFILTADINLEGQVFTTAIIAADTCSDDYFQGTSFTGEFDGNSHKITNFTINGGSNDCLGLFGGINGGSVKNLGLENCSVSGDSYVGSLAGYNNGGDISNCYSTGSVSGSFAVGGLAGENDDGSINNCYSTGMYGGDVKTNRPVITRIAGFQTNETWNVSGTGVTATRDTTPENVKHGNCSLKVYVPKGVTGTTYCTLPIPITVRSAVGFWVKTDNASAISYLGIKCFEDPLKFHTLGMLGQTLPNSILKLQDNTWNFVWLPKAGNPKGGCPWVPGTGSEKPTDWGTVANPTYTVTKIKFIITATGNVNIWFGDLVAQEASKAAIILGFDGPYASVYTEAFPVMKARGWKGVIWDVTGGVTNGMTTAQIQELYDAGWDICSHGHSGKVFGATCQVEASVVVTDLDNAINALKSNGWYRGIQFHSWMGNTGYSLPDANGKSAGDLMKERFLGSRGLSEFTIPANMNGVRGEWYSYQWSPWIPPNWHNLAFFGCRYSSGTDFTDMQGFVDLTIAMRGVLNTYTHRILASPGVNDISTGFFSDMIAYLDTKVATGEIEVITMSDWYKRAQPYANGSTSVSGLVVSSSVGGLVGYNDRGSINNCYFLDTSGPNNGYGEPLTDEQMKQPGSFVGWDFTTIWEICEGTNYPRLRWQFNTADFTCPDGVNFIDFAIFANAWLSDPTQVNWNGRCDIAEPPDSVIDVLDLAIFAQHWLE